MCLTKSKTFLREHDDRQILLISHMITQLTIEELQLASDNDFGLFGQTGVQFNEEWQQEDELRKKSWNNISELTIDIPENIKILARSGIPHDLRRRWWFIASGGYKLYDEVGNIWDDVVRSTNTMDTDANIFGGEINILTFLPPVVSQQVRQFIHILWIHNRQIEFSPLIPTVTALLLLYLEPPLAYLVIQSMINQSKETNWYFTIKREQFLASIQAFRDLAFSKCSDVVIHAEKMGLSVSQIALALFPVFFLPFMPLPVALTVFDSFVIEGRKVLVRFCLCLFIQERKTLLQSKSPDSFISILVNAMERLAQIDAMKNFIQRSFKLYISREKHMRKFENIAMIEKHGIMRIPQYHKYQNFSEMTKETGLNVIQFGKCSISCMNKSLAIEILSQSTPEEIFAQQEKVWRSVEERVLPTITGGYFLNESLFYSIREMLPTTMKRFNAVLTYKMTKDGTTFQAMFEATKQMTSHVMLIKTTGGMFGAVISDPLHTNRVSIEGTYYGRSSTFVFNCDTQESYKHINPPNQLFISVSREVIMIGGPRPAIYIPKDMSKMLSDSCDTFGSPPFTKSIAGDTILDIEIYQLTIHSPTPETNVRSYDF